MFEKRCGHCGIDIGHLDGRVHYCSATCLVARQRERNRLRQREAYARANPRKDPKHDGAQRRKWREQKRVQRDRQIAAINEAFVARAEYPDLATAADQKLARQAIRKNAPTVDVLRAAMGDERFQEALTKELEGVKVEATEDGYNDAVAALADLEAVNPPARLPEDEDDHDHEDHGRDVLHDV